MAVMTAAWRVAHAAADAEPGDPAAWFRTAGCARDAGLLDEAVAAFERCLALSPYFDVAYEGLSDVHESRGDEGAAIATLERWDRAVAGIGDLRFRIGTAHLRRGCYKDARCWFDRGLNSVMAAQGERLLPFGTVTATRLAHDAAQLRWLMARGLLPTHFAATADACDAELLRAPLASQDWERGQPWRLDPEGLLRISGCYRRCLTLAPADAVPDGALGPNPWPEFERRYLDAAVEERFVVIDNLLSADALERLWRYCQDSTIWHNDGQKGRNYLGAYQLSGFRPPLIEQISRELCGRLPSVIGDMRCEQVWAYRTVRGSSAIGIHADFAQVNINFWLTPDRANRAPGRGGLLMCKRAVPEEWTFRDYNDDDCRIAAVTTDAERVVVPYRQNRAVLFDARLFHGSDAVSFGGAYDEHRINVTLLFGKR